MGVGPFRSSSFCGCGQVDVMAQPREKQPGNPDPQEFSIVSIEQRGYYLICTVDYPGCTNYEGRKILVLAGVSEQQLKSAKMLDPHFCEAAHISPVARFEPTTRGLHMARTLVKAL